ncbi:MAG: 23S rRNA (guanosine(2251)-2'-O)-methyltransferase RlmB [Rhodospirillales bacterium]
MARSKPPSRPPPRSPGGSASGPTGRPPSRQTRGRKHNPQGPQGPRGPRPPRAARPGGGSGGGPKGSGGSRGSGSPGGAVWFYGAHTAAAALANRARGIHRVLLAAQAGAGLSQTVQSAMAQGGRNPDLIETLDRTDLDLVLPEGAAHQGVAVLAAPLPETAVEDLTAEGPARVLVLDQVTDPQNIGAVIRTAAAFGARALIIPDKNSPPVTPALAKAASGGLEIVPLVRVTNLVRALYTLKDQGFWCVGLEADAPETLAEAAAGITAKPMCLALGAEGKGLRRLTAQACDALAGIPMKGRDMASLNVSAAAAIALYETVRKL